MSEFTKWVRASGLPITLKNTEELNNYAKQAGWKIADDNDSGETDVMKSHEAAIKGMSDKKKIEKYVIEVCGVDINLQGNLNTVRSKAVKAIRNHQSD
jgi:hypothetical protein